jgi:monomeric sarcosine oxidase
LHQGRIIIVGAGIVGLSTAFALLQQGVENVTVVEQSTVGHERAASHGTSRLLRFEYGTDQFYTEMVQESLQRWRNLEQMTQRSLYTSTGVLVLGNATDDFAQTSYNALCDLGFPSEILSRYDCHERFPQFSLQDYDFFTYNEEGGILHASYCLQTLKDAIRQLGGAVLENQQVMQIGHDNTSKPIQLRLSGGYQLTADRLVLAVGPWVHHLLAEVHLPIRLTRQYLLYFDNLPLSVFGLPTFPAFMAGELYGFPIHDHLEYPHSHWLKVASHTFGFDVDPDNTVYLSPQIIGEVMYDSYRLLPALQHARLVSVESCIYDVSPDEGFILDVLPDDPRVVVASGFSGHGFKFGLLLGEMLSSFLSEYSPPVDMERFRLKRFYQNAHPQQATA